MRRCGVSTVIISEPLLQISTKYPLFANDNVKKNGLESRIRIVQSLPNNPILKSLFEDETFRCDSLVKS